MRYAKFLFLFSSIFLISIVLSGCTQLLKSPPNFQLSIVNAWNLTTGTPTTSGQIYSSAAISPDGRIFVGGQQALYAIHDDSLNFYQSAGAIYSPISIDATNDMVFACNNYGQMIYSKYPFSSYNTVQISYYPIIAAPLLIGNNLYVMDDQGNLFKITEGGSSPNFVMNISSTTGSVVWASMVTNGRDIFLGMDDGTFYAINLESKSIDWQYQLDGPIYGSAAMGKSGNIYLGAKDLYSFSPNGTLRWETSLDGSQIYASPVISDGGTIFVGTIDGNFYAINSQDGQIIWNVNIDTSIGGISSAALIGNGIVYVASGYNFYAISSLNGQILSTLYLGYNVESNPVMYKGNIYFGCDNGNFYEISSQSTSLLGEWPMFLHDQFHTGE